MNMELQRLKPPLQLFYYKPLAPICTGAVPEKLLRPPVAQERVGLGGKADAEGLAGVKVVGESGGLVQGRSTGFLRKPSTVIAPASSSGECLWPARHRESHKADYAAWDIPCGFQDELPVQRSSLAHV